METPQTLQVGDRQELTVQKYEYDGETVIAVDFGRTAGEPSVDIVGDTAIVVGEETQVEFEVPGRADDVAINNGILTISG